ncbi:hypothetical protein VTI74DRAFT_5986 [Chaetomium olivicolor]
MTETVKINLYSPFLILGNKNNNQSSRTQPRQRGRTASHRLALWIRRPRAAGRPYHVRRQLLLSVTTPQTRLGSGFMQRQLSLLVI